MIPGDKACYPGTDVLINKFGISDFEKARSAEYKFASARELQLAEAPIKGKFDIAHLQSIHKHLFQDMYEWAGKLRDIDFAKRSKETGLVTRFIPQIVMDLKIEDFNKFMAEKNHLRGLSKPEFIKGMAEVHTRLNELHPFREGNGRSTRVFLQQLAREAGYEFDFTQIDKDRWNQASHMALPRHNPKNEDEKHFPNQMEIRQIFHETCKPLVAEKEKASPVYNTSQTKSAYTYDGSPYTAKPALTAQLRRESPAHAIAFDRMPPREALRQHPELEGAYRVLAQAKKLAEAQLKGLQDQQKFFNRVRERISANLHEGKEVFLNNGDNGRSR